MTYSTFLITLARRSPEAATLSDVLGTHPEIHSVDDAFSVPTRPRGAGTSTGTDLLGFMARYGASDPRRLLPDRQRTLFRDYLEYLNCFASSRYTLLSLPYDAIGILADPYSGILGPPALLGLARDLGLGVLHLSTTNHLGGALEATGTLVPPTKRRPAKTQVDVPGLLAELDTRTREDAAVAGAFHGYERYLGVDSGDVPPTGDDKRFRKALQTIATWLDLEPRFTSSLAVAQADALSVSEASIANFDELMAALADPTFAHLVPRQGARARAARGRPTVRAEAAR